MPLGLTEIEKATLGWGTVNQLYAPRWIISTPAHAKTTSDDRYEFKWQLKGTLHRIHIWLTSPTKWFKNVTFFNVPCSLTSPPQFVRGFSFSFFLPQAILQGKSRLTGVPSPCVLVWSPAQRQTADLSVLSLCSRLYLQCENDNKKCSAGGSPVSDSCYFLLFLFVWERTPWQSAHPEFDSLKKRSTLRLSSTVWSHQSVMFNLMAKCFSWANFSSVIASRKMLILSIFDRLSVGGRIPIK